MTDGSTTAVEAAGRRRRKEARPAEIIEAGLVEFGARGFEAARMEDVARRAGVAKGTVFRYFATKEALFEAALVSRLTPVFDQIGAAADAHEGPTATLVTEVLGRIYAQISRPEVAALIRTIIAEGPRFPVILASYHRLSVLRGQAVLGRIVERGVASGEFRRGAVADLPMILMAPVLMAAIWRMTFDALQPIPLDRFRAAHLEMILGALSLRDGGAGEPGKARQGSSAGP